MQTNVCGTARMNRKDMPPGLKFHKLEKGETIVSSIADMATIKWKDKKRCCFINNYAYLRFYRNEKNKPIYRRKKF